MKKVFLYAAMLFAALVFASCGDEESETAVNDPAVKAGICPDANHPHLIDLGDAGKWACCNVGAKSPWENGNYFNYGATDTQSSDYCVEGGEISGNEAYDAATAGWGGNWKMPTSERFSTLKEKCTFEWITLKGTNGGKFTAPNGNSIFLPAAGIRCEGHEDGYRVGNHGYYWSSTSYGQGQRADCLIFDHSGAYVNNDYGRFEGRSIRPVQE